MPDGIDPNDIDLDSFREWLSMAVAETSVQTYIDYVKVFLDWCIMNNEKVDVRALNKYISYKRSSGSADSTVRTIFYSLKKLYTYLGMGLEVSTLVPPKVRSSKRRVTHYDTVVKMINHSKYLEDVVMILLLYDCALRVGELCSLKVEDVVLDTEKPYIKVWTEKQRGGKKEQDTVVLSRITVDTLLTYLEKTNLRPSDWLIPSRRNIDKPISKETVRYRLKTIACAAGLDTYPNPHSFRHGRIEDILRVSIRTNTPVDPSQVQRFSRHRSYTSTLRYLNIMGIEVEGQNIPDMDEVGEE